MGPVRVVRAFRLSMIAAAAALVLSGCMGRSGPVDVAQPYNDLDSLVYGQPVYAPAPVGYVPPMAYGTPASPAYDQKYRLDAGDKLRVVVYGQEGLTNSYAIDAGGSITMPLIGAVPARRRTTAGVAGGIGPRPRQRDIPQPLVGRENENYPPCFLFREVAPP